MERVVAEETSGTGKSDSGSAAQIAIATFGAPHSRLDPVPVVEAEPTRTILDALADQSSRKILSSTITRAKTAKEISSEQALPLSSCYKRIRRLANKGLLVADRKASPNNGRKFTTYRSAISHVAAKIIDGKIDLWVGFNPATIDELDRRMDVTQRVTAVEEQLKELRAKA